jgi:hypothetical protein
MTIGQNLKSPDFNTNRSVNIVDLAILPCSDYLYPVMAAASQPNFLLCQLCGKHVALESCKTDENGKAVHDECYARSLAAPDRTEPAA